MLGSAKSEKVRLISHEIIFQEFQPIWPGYLNVTDGQTDGGTDNLLKQYSALSSIAPISGSYMWSMSICTCLTANHNSKYEQTPNWCWMILLQTFWNQIFVVTLLIRHQTYAPSDNSYEAKLNNKHRLPRWTQQRPEPCTKQTTSPLDTTTRCTQQYKQTLACVEAKV